MTAIVYAGGRKKKGAFSPIVVTSSARGNSPQCIILPVVTGTATIGSTVTVSQGTWLNNPGTFYYQWQRNLSDIPGAIFTTYTLQSADLSQSITCLVTAWNAFGVGVARTLPFIPIASGGEGSGLSSPTLGFPSSQTLQPTLSYRVPIDWQSGDIAKLVLSASSAMTSPTTLTHLLTDTDITNGVFSFPLPILSSLTYFQAYGNHGGTNSTFLSNIVAWGDTVAPVITTAATYSITEQTALALTLAVTDAGGVPALVSDGTSPGWYVSGGADKLQEQIVIIGGVPTLEWFGNGIQSFTSPKDFGADNVYNSTIVAVDYSGNQSSPLSLAITVTQIDTTPVPFTFTNVNNAALSTLETSNTVTISGLETGFQIASSMSGTGFTYSKNGGAYQAPGSFTVGNGDTLTLQAASPSANNLSESCTVTVGTYSTTWTIATPVTTTTFNPSDKATNITLSNANLTAQNAGGASGPNPVRTVNSYTTGKHVVRFHVDTARGWYGIEDGTQVLNNFPSSSMCLAHDGSVFVGAGSASSLTAPANGDTVDIAWDADNKKAWLRKNATWHTTCGDPTASGAGFDISSMASTLFPFFLGFDNLSQATLQAVTLTGFTSVI